MVVTLVLLWQLLTITAMLTDMFNINSSSRHQEYSKFLSSLCHTSCWLCRRSSCVFKTTLVHRFQASSNRSSSWQL